HSSRMVRLARLVNAPLMASPPRTRPAGRSCPCADSVDTSPRPPLRDSPATRAATRASRVAGFNAFRVDGRTGRPQGGGMAPPPSAAPGRRRRQSCRSRSSRPAARSNQARSRLHSPTAGGTIRTVAAVAGAEAGAAGTSSDVAADGAAVLGAAAEAAGALERDAAGGASGWAPVLRREDGGGGGGGGGALPASSAPRSYGALRAWPSMSSVTSASTVPASIAGLPAGRWPSAVTL